MNDNSSEPQVFTLIRHADQTGISGTGRVIDGVIFHTGQVVICWRTDLAQQENALAAWRFMLPGRHLNTFISRLIPLLKQK